MLLRTRKDLCQLSGALGAVWGRKLYGKVIWERKTEGSSFLAVTDCLKCFGVSRDPGFLFDYSTEQVVNHTEENFVMLLNKQCV